MTTLVVQDLRDGLGLDLLDADYDLLAAGLSVNELIDELYVYDDGDLQVLVSDITGNEETLPVTLDEAIEFLRDYE